MFAVNAAAEDDVRGFSLSINQPSPFFQSLISPPGSGPSLALQHLLTSTNMKPCSLKLNTRLAHVAELLLNPPEDLAKFERIMIHAVANPQEILAEEEARRYQIVPVGEHRRKGNPINCALSLATMGPVQPLPVLDSKTAASFETCSAGADQRAGSPPVPSGISIQAMCDWVQHAARLYYAFAGPECLCRLQIMHHSGIKVGEVTDLAILGEEQNDGNMVPFEPVLERFNAEMRRCGGKTGL
jgi:hypothetical protein